MFHLPCLLRYNKPVDYSPPPLLSYFLLHHDDSDVDETGTWDRSIGPKVDHAALLRSVLREGCPMEIEGQAGDG